jgi:hypothetical protein
LFSLLHSSLNRKNLEPEYVTLLNRAIALGYTRPSAAQQVKQNQLIRSLKSEGIWTLLDVFYVYANDGSKEFATLNWKSPSTFQSTMVNSPSWTGTLGFTSNGTSSYINTNWNPSTNGVNFTLNNAAIIIHVNGTGSASSGVDMGANGASGVGRVKLNARRTDNTYLAEINVSTVVTGGATTNALGFFQLRRIASNSYAVFKNGSSQFTSSQASTVMTTSNFYVGGLNSNGTPANLNNRAASCFGAGASLSGLENTLYTVWNTYISNL